MDPSYTYKWPAEWPKGEERPTFKNGKYVAELEKVCLPRQHDDLLLVT